ncbi:GNAT family N-acetyltransferase [Pontibacter sp. E15-1]|uniref:GNAT family N-acetyltransferase n=1 Tax=Pontibacter sp. E15-1 TaxID=2919918 RepID=UPI001F4F5F4E|nr:GNAT family N-acetyltransferase [Pontibacter sp. E15-1]MCJ8167227.1 GNAT family N-acetyltransferase [Pontibacter sp. E15-1]
MRAEYSIRTASLADVPLIEALAAATWEPTYGSILCKEQIHYMFGVIYSGEALERQMQEGQTFLLFLEAEVPVGFAAYSGKDAAEGVYKLNKIYLLPEAQGKGYGKAFLAAVEDEVSALGARFLDLNVNRHNKAREFYGRCGYQVHLQEDIPIGPYWMNDFVMRKEL